MPFLNSNSCRNCHITNTTIIPIRYPRKSAHSPLRAPWVLYLPTHSRLVRNQHHCMVHITVAVIENSAWVKLKSISRNSNRYRTIIKLINQRSAIALFDVAERCHFKTPTLSFACSRHSWYCRCVRIVHVCLNTFDLHVSVRALQKSAIAAISEPIARTIYNLLGWKSHKKTIFINCI